MYGILHKFYSNIFSKSFISAGKTLDKSIIIVYTKYILQKGLI